MSPVDNPISLSHKLSLWLAIQTLLALALFSFAIYFVISSHLTSRQKDAMLEKQALVHHLVEESRQTGDIEELRHQLDDFLAGHHELVIELKDANGKILYQNSDDRPDSAFVHITEFPIPYPDSRIETAVAIIKHDGHADGELLKRLAMTLLSISVLGMLIISYGAYRLVKKGLKPVDDLALQTATLTAESLSSNLDGSAQPKELQPLVTQFNDLLERLSLSYRQLEHFNADVAHELNTPLTTLITSSELALRNPQDLEDLRDILGSNLEELHRMSGIVKDMLFLSRAERGSRARCEHVKSLAAIAEEVVDYHEASLSDAKLTTKITGNASGEFDIPLVKRALSNLLGNAAAYASTDSVVTINIHETEDQRVKISVVNSGNDIPPNKLERIFDRFYRLDDSRSHAEKHHGLGLSIVSGIARMHGGVPYAQSSGSRTEVGLNLPKLDQTQSNSPNDIDFDPVQTPLIRTA